MPRVVVVGGGLAGITAALAIADERDDADITLLESRSQLGGRVTSITDPASGIALDNCQHACFRVYSRFLQLIARSGAYASIKLQSRTEIPFMQVGGGRIAALRDGKLAPPNHMAGSLLTFPFLSFKDKLAMRKVIKELAGMSAEDMSSLDDQDFRSWLQAKGQSERAINRFWGYFVMAALNTPVEQASAALSAFLFQRGLFGDPHAFDVGAFTSDLSDSIHPDLHSALKQAGVEIRLNTSARGLRWQGTCTAVELADEVLECDEVVLALPHHLCARILSSKEMPEQVQSVVDHATSLRYTALIGIHALHSQQVLPDDFTFCVCVDEPVIQMLFNRSAEVDPGNMPVGITQWVSIPVSAAGPWLDWKEEKFLTEYTRVMKSTFPERWEEPEVFKVIKSKKATFAATPGSAKHRVSQDTIRDLGVHIAGSWTDTGWPSTMESAVRSGLLAAASLLAIDWDADDEWRRWPRPPERGDEQWRSW